MTAADNPYLDAALRYAALGLPVFPCAPAQKKPITKHGFRDATTDAATVRAWWRASPRANVAMPTGAASGLIVIDVDPRNGGDVGIDELETRNGKLPETAMSLTGDGGRHLFLQHPGGYVPCTHGALAAGIDVKGDGGYVVMPPSTHPSGNAYTWELSSDIADVRPALCPDWLFGFVCQDGRGPPTAQQSDDPDGNTIPEGQRNNALASLAGGMRRMGMGRDEILSALRATNQARCRPPLPEAEIARIASSIARYAPDAVSVALVENHYAQMFGSGGDEPAPGDGTANPDPGPMPDALLEVPGFIHQVVEYTLQTAPYPQPVLAFAAALTLQAFLAGRKVRDAGDNHTNIYVLALANSGAGKDHPRKVNQRVVIQAGLQNNLGDAFASGEGIEDRMFVTPSLLFQTDEIDGLMTAINKTRDARHESIMNVLLKMYTSSAALYPMRVKAGKQNPGVIDQPSLCMFGTAVPKYYYEALSIRMLNNGFFARLLILEVGKRGIGQTPVDRPLPTAIVDVARWWAEFKPGGEHANLQQWHPQPAVIGHTDAATAVLDDFRRFADQRYAEAEEKDDPAAMAIWARAHEKARKLALIYAVSENHQRARIDEAAARWAWGFVDYQTRRMLFMASQHVAEGEFDAKCKRMLEVLSVWRQKRGDAWMPHWEMSRRLKWSDRDLEEVRNALMGQKRIQYEMGTTPRGGSPGQRYRLITEATSE